MDLPERAGEMRCVVETDINRNVHYSPICIDEKVVCASEAQLAICTGRGHPQYGPEQAFELPARDVYTGGELFDCLRSNEVLLHRQQDGVNAVIDGAVASKLTDRETSLGVRKMSRVIYLKHVECVLRRGRANPRSHQERSQIRCTASAGARAPSSVKIEEPIGANAKMREAVAKIIDMQPADAVMMRAHEASLCEHECSGA